MKKISNLIFIVLFPFAKVFAGDSTLVIAHRGANSLAPENTLSAFQKAIDLGVDYLECDVQKTSDDSLIVIHDASVNRTTNGTGNISSLTYKQIRALDAGYSKIFGSQFLGEKIPTFKEFLTLAKKNNFKVVPELKINGIAAKVNKMIVSMGMQNQATVQSFSINELQILRTINPDIAVLYLSNSASITNLKALKALSGSGKKVYAPSGASLFSFNSNNPFPFMDSLKLHNIKTIVWTINTNTDYLNLMSIGVDGIMSDYPQNLIQLKNNLSTLNVISFWNFEEGSGTIINDLSLNKNTGTATNPIWINTGASSNTLEFNSLNQVSIPQSNSLDMNTDAMSISMWVYLTELPSVQTASFGGIFDSAEDAYILYTDKANKELKFKLITANSTVRLGIPESKISLNTWIHLSAVYNGTNVILYYNGKRMATANATGNVKKGQIAIIGKDFKGKIDEIKIYKREFSYTEAKALSAPFPVITGITTNNLDKNSAFKIYPNPSSSGIFNLESINSPTYSYLLINEKGEIIENKISNTHNSFINIASAPKGIYFLLIQTEKHAMKYSLIHR